MVESGSVNEAVATRASYLLGGDIRFDFASQADAEADGWSAGGAPPRTPDSSGAADVPGHRKI